MNFNVDAFCVIIFVFFIFAAISSLISLRLSEKVAPVILGAARGAVQMAAIVAVFSLGYLIYAFLTDNFLLNAVAQYSSKDLAIGYKISAVWAGASGSLLLWSVVLFILMAAWTNKAGDTHLEITTLAVGSALCAGFAAMLVFVAKPFAHSAIAPADGAGLNPLLLNFWMEIHPPLLFLGYSGFLIPFVLAVAGVFSGTAADAEFYYKIRRWFLPAFCFLSLGIATGAKWAYVVLGWGGFWGWDPVENASLLPWLVALAAMHVLAVTRRTSKYRVWTIALVSLPFLLCLAAAFITRSGVVQSVHAFGANPMSEALLILIGFVCGLWLVAVVTAGIRIAWPRSASGHATQVGDQGWFLPALSFITALVLIFTAVAVMTGTFWPVLSQFLKGQSFTPLRGFYDRIISVAAITLVVLLIICSIANWNRNNRIKALGVVMAHLGLLLLVASVGVGVFGEKESQLHIAKGTTQKAGGYNFTYLSFKHEQSGKTLQVGPEIELNGHNKKLTLWPHRNIYENGQMTTEVVVKSSPQEDVYIVFDGLDESDKVLLTVLFKPMMMWLWIAMLLIVLGAAWMRLD